MREDSARRGEANRARMRRLREQYRRRLIAAIIICFVLGVVAGVFAYRWYAGRTPRDAVATPAPVVTATPETPALEDDAPGLFIDDADDGAAVQEAFPEVKDDDATAQDAFPEDEGEEVIFPEDEVEALPDEDETYAADATNSDETGEYDLETAEIPEEYLNIEDEQGVSEGSEDAEANEQPEEGEATGEGEATEAAEQPAEEAEATEAPEVTQIPEATEAPEQPAGPQVIAIVPFGESFTYTTQIDADGNARVDTGEGAYETLSFTQTMKSFMRPTDFADKYAKTYKLSGDEAGAGFELILNDYTGAATVVPQNIIDISMRSESGNTVERGYQLMDAPIDGNYGVALTTNTPKLLYKRFPYSDAEEMAYLVVTTYNDGVGQMILFEVESNEPEVEEETVYPILQKGLVGDAVVAMQARLIELGYLTGTADGTFGAMTEEAIRKAQEAFGMEVNGIADNAFQQKLYEGVEPVAAPEGAENYETLNEASTGEAVVNLQLRLRELGYYDGRADGGYGPKTVAAVKKAQAAFGMAQTGLADGAFQARLYAGAEPTPEPTAESTPEPTPNNVAGENTVG